MPGRRNTRWVCKNNGAVTKTTASHWRSPPVSNSKGTSTIASRRRLAAA
jgi:hypothetical protein